MAFIGEQQHKFSKFHQTKNPMESEERFISNPFGDLWKSVEAKRQNIHQLFLQRLTEFEQNVPVPCSKAICSQPNETDECFSIFQGSSGYLYLYLKLYRFFASLASEQAELMKKVFKYGDAHFFKFIDPQQYLNKAKEQYEESMKQAKKTIQKKRINISFCMSKASIYLSGAHLGFLTDNQKLFKDSVSEILKFFQIIMANPDVVEKELLYGVPGYLYILLELQSYYQPHSNPDYNIDLSAHVARLVELIMSQGIKGFQKVSGKQLDIAHLPKDFRLVYIFGGKEYFGGAHGLAGALNMVFLSMYKNKLPQELIQKIMHLCLPSVEFMVGQMHNGNVPTRAGGNNYKLVQFCHGAPGVVTPLLHCCNLFPEQSAKLNLKSRVAELLEHIWRYGVLKKGFYGLCHGVSGNAYQFISPVCKKVMSDHWEQYLKKASLIWLLQLDDKVMKTMDYYEFEDRFLQGISDYPYSLMLGRAGDIIFCCDLIKGQGHFPGYDI